MNATHVLVISRDSSLTGRIRDELNMLGGVELQVAEGLERAFMAVSQGNHQVVVAHLNSGIEKSQLGRMIREVTSQQMNLVFIAVSDSYKSEEAIDLFRLGVADYLSVSDHREQIAPVIKSISANCAAPRQPEKSEVEQESAHRGNIRRPRVSTMAS
ncbi:hypothetical protein [Singulisphaera sp. PoT]|uniref:hypothetical protein n=1 Tax=Singulisphaera sp. PoT TaxID=3411797 RepID=UPI003BF50AFC